ncbi:MAG: flippase activity-associated protein Agl23 [Chloroflexota bacterium]
MAEVTLPARGRSSWLDRPLVPSRERLAVLLTHWELILYTAVVILGFVLRIWDVGGRAMHHDESLHAYYSWKLFAGQGYSYDPLMHGPLQFEVVPVLYLLFGVSEFSARLLAVLLGTGLIALPFFLRHHLTRPGAILASVMLAISPSLVYFSRFIRDDIYLAFFALWLFICVVRYLETHQNRYLYMGAVAMALAVASMEAAYLLFFTFGTFIIFEALRELLSSRDGPVLQAFKATSLDAWLTAISIFVVITVILYSTFFTNPYGIWDPRYSLTSPNRQDILGGLTYWQAQHSVDRGGQPWFYYLLVLPLYEQLAVLFGAAGIIFAVARRSLVRTFLVWWGVGSLLIYSWAGEKMPWLSIHIVLPFILLAALFLGHLFTTRRGWPVLLTASILALLGALEVHSTFALSFQDGANPTEMLIYVQTSQDVPNVVHEIGQISHRVAGGNTLPIGLDTNDVGGWPFQWYLRNYPYVYQTTTFNGPTCGGQYCPVLLMLGPEFDASSSSLLKHYVAQKYRWNWWFPEDYKQWFPDHPGTVPLSIAGRGQLASDPVGTPSDWKHLWNWLVYRQPFGDRGARWLYFLVRRDLVPGSKYFSTKAPSSIGPVSPPVLVNVPKMPSRIRAVAGGPSVLAGPRGIAAAPNGDLYVADPPNHRIVEFSASGSKLRSWGSPGSSAGQFAQLDSPQGVAVAPDGDVYVADTWNQRIQVFSPTGAFLRSWGGGPIGAKPGEFYGPRSIAVSPSGRVYVADTGNERIQVFSATGHFITSFGTRGSAPGQFNEPSSVTIGRGGMVYVADFWNQRIQEFSPAGTFIRSWPVPDWTPHSYDEPYIAANRKTGVVYASEPQQRRILAWSSTGKLIGQVSNSQLSLPVGVTVKRNGDLVVGDVTSRNANTFTLLTHSHRHG